MMINMRNSLSKITKANYVGLSRLLITPFTVVFILNHYSKLAIFTILLAGLCDILDGYLARRYNTVSNFGVFLDLTADKIYISAILFCFTSLKLIPLWISLVIITREFLVMGVRCYAAAEEKVVIPAKALGGIKIVVTFFAIMAVLLNVVFSYYLLYFAAFLTIVSGLDYCYQARHLLAKGLYHNY